MSTTLLKWFLITVLVGISYVSAQSVVPAEYFGMHLLKSQQWPSVPFGSLRLWDTDTRWQQMNPANGVFDFSSLDAYLLLANAHRVADVVLVLGGTPNWFQAILPMQSAITRQLQLEVVRCPWISISMALEPTRPGATSSTKSRHIF